MVLQFYEKYPIICFDFDGVIIESSLIKTLAYRELFEKYFPEKISEIIDYHLSNSGLVRYKKIRYVCEKIMKINDADAIIEKLIVEYEEEISKKVIECPFVPGVIDFLELLARLKKRLYVVSGTPDDELKKIVALRGLGKYFYAIYGGSELKEFWLNKIISDNGCLSSDILFIGDGLNDYEAARVCGTDFVFRETGENNYLRKKIINCLHIIEDYNNILINKKS